MRQRSRHVACQPSPKGCDMASHGVGEMSTQHPATSVDQDLKSWRRRKDIHTGEFH